MSAMSTNGLDRPLSAPRKTDARRLAALSWAAVLAWAAFVFLMSANTGDSLDHGGSIVSAVYQWLKEAQASVLGHGHDLVNPIAHFCEYAVFGALLANAWIRQAAVSHAEGTEFGTASCNSADPFPPRREGAGCGGNRLRRDSTECGRSQLRRNGAGCVLARHDRAGCSRTNREGARCSRNRPYPDCAGCPSRRSESPGRLPLRHESADRFPPDRRRTLATVAFAVACASLYGATDEIHQLFVPGRSADPADWLTDTCGALLGSVLFCVIGRRRR